MEKRKTPQEMAKEYLGLRLDAPDEDCLKWEYEYGVYLAGFSAGLERAAELAEKMADEKMKRKSMAGYNTAVDIAWAIRAEAEGKGL